MSARRTSGFGLSSQQRLHSGDTFRAVLRQAPLRVSGQYLVLLGSFNALGYPRLGLVVSRKTARRAVQRNRLKRLLRESFRLHQHQLPDTDIIVLGRRSIHELSSDEFRAILAEQWRALAAQAARLAPAAGSGGAHDAAASD